MDKDAAGMDGEHPEWPAQWRPKGDRQQVEPTARWVEQRLADKQSETARRGQQAVLEIETGTYEQAPDSAGQRRQTAK